MGNFRQEGNRTGFGRSRSGGGRFGGSRAGGGFQNRGGFGGRDRFPRRPVEMHEATCAKCGQRCQIPFKPTGDKPVYCSDCFEKKDNSNSRNQNSSVQSGVSQDQFNQLNKKLDKIIQILEELEIVSDEEAEDGLENDLDEELEDEEDLDEDSDENSDNDSEDASKNEFKKE